MRSSFVRSALALAAVLFMWGASPAGAADRVDEAGARALLQRWLAAQNDGDFAAYEATYAQRFFGVRRSGPRTRTFDRADWVKDRARMFKKKMQVSADRVVVNTTGDAATVTFTQTWASGSYKDVGQKQLVVVPEAHRPVIAREEMLRSELVDGAARPAPPDAAQLSFAFEAAGHTWVLLGRDQAETVRVQGKPALLGESPVFVAAPVDAGAPAGAAAWVGKKLRLYDASGVACEGVVEGLWLGERYWAHFGMLATWNGTGDHEGEPPTPQDERAAEAWKMLGASERLILARVGDRTGTCGPSVWARDAAAPEAPLVAAAAADAGLSRKALAAFRKLSGWARLQKDYATDATGEKKPDWMGYEESAPSVSTFRMPDGRVVVTVTAAAGSGCGDFRGELWAAWELKGKGDSAALVLLSDEADPGGAFQPKAAVDVDGDGTIELLGLEQLFRMGGATLRLSIDAEPPSFDCPC